jgi:hypothetical protein
MLHRAIGQNVAVEHVRLVLDTEAVPEFSYPKSHTFYRGYPHLPGQIYQLYRKFYHEPIFHTTWNLLFTSEPTFN